MKTATGSIWYDPSTGDMYARVSYTDPETGRRKDRKQRADPQTITRVNELCKEMIQELDEDGPQAFSTSRVTFSQLCDYYEENYLVDAEFVAGQRVHGLKTFEEEKRKLKLLKAHFKQTPLRKITHGTINLFRLKMLRTPVVFKNGDGEITGTRDRSLASAQRSLSTLRRMLKIAMGECWIRKDPFIGPHTLISLASETKRERILTYDEEDALLAVCVAPREHLRPKVVCARDTGMRKGEIETLLWEDIDIPNHRILVPAFRDLKANTKTLRSRSVPISDRLLEELYELAGDRLGRVRKGIPLGDKGRVFGSKSIKTAWHTAMREAKIEDFHFHDLRHTFATRMRELGLDSMHVSRLLGHAMPGEKESATTYRYTNITTEMLEIARQLLNREQQEREQKRQGTSVSDKHTPSPQAEPSVTQLSDIQDISGSHLI